MPIAIAITPDIFLVACLSLESGEARKSAAREL
jgi:hypothetical protein